MRQFADVLIVTGQGVWLDGRFYAEFKDIDVYLSHLKAAGRIAIRYRYTHVVLSGGRTQRKVPTVSEAAGMYALLRELGILMPSAIPIILDHHAYDSAENIFMGLIAARMYLADVPIRRIGISNCWLGKKRRFFLAAKELNIEDRFFFHGHAPWDRALDPQGALAGENKQCALVENDPIMLDPKMWDGKRCGRYYGDVPFESRFKQFAALFPQFIAALDGIRRNGRGADGIAALRGSFSQEILRDEPA